MIVLSAIDNSFPTGWRNGETTFLTYFPKFHTVAVLTEYISFSGEETRFANRNLAEFADEAGIVVRF